MCCRVRVLCTGITLCAAIQQIHASGFIFANYTWTFPVWTTLSTMTNTTRYNTSATASVTQSSSEGTTGATATATVPGATAIVPGATATVPGATATVPGATATPQGTTLTSVNVASDIAAPTTAGSSANGGNSSSLALAGLGGSSAGPVATPTVAAQGEAFAPTSSSAVSQTESAAPGVASNAPSYTSSVAGSTPPVSSFPSAMFNTSYAPSTSPNTSFILSTTSNMSYVSSTIHNTSSVFNTTTNLLSAPGTTPNTSSVLSNTTNASFSPGSTPNASSIPNNTPNASSIPNNTPNASSIPNTTPNASSIPNTTPNASSIPNTTLNASSIPNTTPNASSIPNTTPNASSIPNTTPNASSIPNTTPNASTILQNYPTTTSTAATPTSPATTTTASSSSAKSLPPSPLAQSASTANTPFTRPTSTTDRPTAQSASPTASPNQNVTYSRLLEQAGYEHTYYLAVPHVAADLNDHPNASLTIYVTLTTTDPTNVTGNVSIFYPYYENIQVKVQPGQGVTVRLSSLLMPDVAGVSKRGIKIHSSGCLHVILFCIIEDMESGMIRSLTSTYVSPQFTLSSDYVVVASPTSNSSAQSTTSRLFIVSTADDNQVSIRLSSYPTSSPITFTINEIRLTNPDVVNVTLNQSDVFLLESEADLTGSRITSSSRVAVFVGIKQTGGSDSFEQLTPVLEEVNHVIITWPPIPSVASLYRISTGGGRASVQVSDNFTCVFPEPGDTCELHATAESSRVVADSPVTGLHAILNNNSDVECLSQLPAPSAWRNFYTWTIPRNFTQTPNQLQPEFFLIGSESNLSIGGSPLKPDTVNYEGTDDGYVILTKRVASGYNYIQHDSSSYFGAFLYGRAQSAMFCTTLGVDHLNKHPTRLGSFPNPQNKLYHFTPGADPVGVASITTTAATPPAQTESSSTPTVAAALLQVTSALPQLQRYGAANLTSAQVEEVLDEIKEVLKVDSRKLSAFTRRLSSAYDGRPSCKNMGCVGAALVVTVFLLMVIGDAIHACFWVADSFHRHYRGIPQTRH